MIEFDTCMATAERINPTILPSSHAPPPFYHHHHHHHHHHHSLGHHNNGGHNSQVIGEGHHQHQQQNGIVSHPRLNSLLTKSSAEQLAPVSAAAAAAPSLPLPPPPSLPPVQHTPNHPVHHTMNGHSQHSNNSHHNGHHHNHNHNHNQQPQQQQQQQHSTTTAKKVDRSSAACSSSVQHGHNQSTGKKHSQIVSKLQQSISSRLKQTGAAAAAASAATAHQHQSESPLLHHPGNGTARSRTHSLPPHQSTPGNVGDMSTIHPAPAALMASKANILKISTTTTKQSQAAVPPATLSPNSLEDAKKKKKSHLSRDELSRVCQCGDVTFEAYNGSTYMIAIRSMGDRKSLIGYRCDWNACGYMNARVERMFGHIRSQHPEAPTVKKLVTTTGATMTTSTVTTTTSSGNSAQDAASAAATTTTTSSTNNMATMSTTSSSSGCNSGTVSARLSLRSSSSLSTASSASSCSQLSPRSLQKAGIAASSSSQPSALMSVLNGTGDVATAPAVTNKVVKKAHNKPSQGSKSSITSNTTTTTSSSALDALENITASMASHDHVALSETSSQLTAAVDAAATASTQLKHTEVMDSVKQSCSEEEKLMDLLNQSGNDTSVTHIKREDEQEMQNMTVGVKKEEEEEEKMSTLINTADSVTDNNSVDIGLGNSDQQQQFTKVELNSPIDEMIAEANLDGDKLAALDPAELAETTEQIMQELKTISSNCEQQQSSTASSEALTGGTVSAPEFVQHHNSPLNNPSSFPSPVDRNNNHHLGNGTAAGVVGQSAIQLEPQSSVMTNMCNGSENLMNSSNTTDMQSLEQENKIVDSLDLFDADIEQLLLNEQPEHHHNDEKLSNYSTNTFNLDGSKYVANTGEQQVMSAASGQQHMQQQSPNVTFQCQGQAQVTSSPTLVHQHNLPPLAPITTTTPTSMNTPTTNGSLLVDPSQQIPEDYEDYHNLSEFSFDSINGTGDSMMDMNGCLDGEKMHAHSHSQSVSSEHMLYGDGNEAAECFDMESGMHDDGSNGSGSSSAGSGKGSRTGKKTGSSKNYIGKQNLFQEFQSEDVAKVRDSENQYIIALQKNMKIVGYRCDWPECEFLTCRKYVMVNHINGKHTNQRPYSCPLCNFNFVKRYFLKAHMHKVHKRRISIDGKDDDDDMPPMRGDKRDHDMMDSFDDNQFEGIPDTPETPNTASVASATIVPPVAQSSKKSKSQKTSEPPAYPSAMSNGNGPAYYSNSGNMTDAYCPPLVPNASGEFGGSVVGAGDIPATVQQYSNYSSSGSGGYPHHNSHHHSMDPMISGRGQMSGTGAGCYYGEDAYGSDMSAQGGNAMTCNTAAAAYKGNGGQMNSSATSVHQQHQQSAVFMTPSPSSSVASPLSFPTAKSAGTPTQKCAFQSQVSMYDSFGDNSMQYSTTGTAGNNYVQPPQQQQQPFINRSYSQSSQSSNGMYGNAVAGKSPLSSGGGGMMNTADLLTPPLSSGDTPNSQGNCCRSGSISGANSAGGARMSVTPSAGTYPPPQDSFNSNSFTSEGMTANHTYQNNVNGGFDDFLSPPSSISSSNSNFSGYMNMCGADLQSQQQSSAPMGASATAQRQSSVGGGGSCQANTVPASASMANASSFYLHTPSPSPSSLSHSPASAPVYGSTAAAAASYNNSMSSQATSNQYQTNFSNAFPNSTDLTGNNSSGGNTATMVAQSPSHSSYPTQPHLSKTFPQSHASFAQQQQQQHSMRSVQSQSAASYSSTSQSQSMQYGNSYEGSGYFEQHTESAYPVSGRTAGKSTAPAAAAATASANSANHFYGNFAPMNPTSGLFDSYADSYPVGGTVASGAAPKQQMYPGSHHQQMPTAAQAQAQTTFNGAQYW